MSKIGDYQSCKQLVATLDQFIASAAKTPLDHLVVEVELKSISLPGVPGQPFVNKADSQLITQALIRQIKLAIPELAARALAAAEGEVAELKERAREEAQQVLVETA